jgi:hypothetical protein
MPRTVQTMRGISSRPTALLNAVWGPLPPRQVGRAAGCLCLRLQDMLSHLKASQKIDIAWRGFGR